MTLRTSSVHAVTITNIFYFSTVFSAARCNILRFMKKMFEHWLSPIPPNISKPNKRLSPLAIEHDKYHDIWRRKIKYRQNNVAGYLFYYDIWHCKVRSWCGTSTNMWRGYIVWSYFLIYFHMYEVIFSDRLANLFFFRF